MKKQGRLHRLTEIPLDVLLEVQHEIVSPRLSWAHTRHT
jgi:hypothetical protein